MSPDRKQKHGKAFLKAVGIAALIMLSAFALCFLVPDTGNPRPAVFALLAALMAALAVCAALLVRTLGHCRRLAEKNKSLTDDVRRLQVAFNQLGSMVFEYDIKSGQIVNISKAICDMYDLPRVVKTGPLMLVERGHVAREYAKDFLEAFDKTRRGAKQTTAVFVGTDAMGRFVWSRVILTSRYNKAGKAVKAIGTLERIGENKAMELRYIQEESYRASAANDSLIILTVDLSTTRIISVIKLGVTTADADDGLFYNNRFQAQLLKDVHDSDKKRAAAFFDRDALINQYYTQTSAQTLRCEYRLLRKSPGEYIWVTASARVMQQPGNGDIVCFFYIVDTHEEIMKRQETRYRLERDALTGLYNRATGQMLINNKLKSTDAPHVFLIFDLDNFKTVNDTLGHSEGDALLKRAAGEIKAAMGDTSIAARLGGDEFIGLMPCAGSRVQAVERVQAICGAIAEMRGSDGARYGVSVSIGAAFAPDDGCDFQTLYEKSDTALYKAKQAGKCRAAVYEAETTL